MAQSDNSRHYYEHPNHREPTQRTQWEHHGMNGTPGGGGVRRPPPGGGGGGNYEEHYDRPTVGDHHYRPEGMVEQTRSAADHNNESFYSRQRMLEEQKFKDQLREGFLELRNHHQNKSGMNRPSSQNNMYSAPPTGVVAPTQQQMVPRNRGQTEPPRPLSMHATPSGYPSYGSSGPRDYEYGTTSSHGSADSYHAVPTMNHHTVGSGGSDHMFRSNSDHNLDSTGHSNYSTTTSADHHPLHREFGSADLAEAKRDAGYAHSTDAEFFDMLRAYKADNADQRAPAPPGIQKVLRGESEASSNTKHSSPVKQATVQPILPHHATPYNPHQSQSAGGNTPHQPQPAGNIPPGQFYQQQPIHSTPNAQYQQPQIQQSVKPAPPPQTHQPHQQPFISAQIPPANPPIRSSSPPTHQALEYIKRSPKASKKQRPRSGDVSALLRKLKPTYKNDGDSTARSTDSGSDHLTGVLIEFLPEERIRKKAFVHYDVQSVGINFVEAATKRQSSTQQGNTRTGASAASDETSSESPYMSAANKSSSPLVAYNAAFVNEVGGEEVRNVALTRVTASKRVQQLIAGNGKESAYLTSPEVHRSPICNGLSLLDGLPGGDNRQSLVEKHRGVYVLEYRDKGCIYYRQHFRQTEHHNYFGVDENVGPVAISIKREKVNTNTKLSDPVVKQVIDINSKQGSEPASQQQYRVVVRTSELRCLRGVILEDALPTAARLSNSSRGLPAKDIIEYVVPEVQLSSLKQAINDEKTKDQLLALDEQQKSDSYKIGIMYCKSGQSTEEEMYNNEHSSAAFDEFLDLIGKQVKLKGFDKYKGGLDNKTDTTGCYSYYTTCQASEIMFHVSTLLPFENNVQQLLRKRHIGNDIVTVVFQEPGSLPFDVTSVRSHFQHVFIIVRVHDPNTDHTSYSVAVTRSKDVPSFGPPISQGNYLHSAEFADFLIAKILNAENAAHLSDKFQNMAVRTRGEYMKDLASNFVTNNSLENNSKLGKFSLGGSKKKEKKMGKVVPDNLTRGGIVWPAQLEDFSLSTTIDIYLVISADVIAVIDMDTSEVFFSCWCSSVIGWTNSQTNESGQAPSLRVYFNQGDCFVIRPIDNEDTMEIVERLRIVTLGCETEEMVLQRNDLGQLGFHVHSEGLVSDVERLGYAWHAGLRTGSRLVEICKVGMVTLTHEQMIDLLRNSSTVKVNVIAPHEEGKPRRSLDEREKLSDYYMLYPADDSRVRNQPPPPSSQHNQHQTIDGEESSAYFSDDENSPQSTVMSKAKRVNTVTLRSSSSGGSSCSPGSTLSAKNNKHADRHGAQSDGEPTHPGRRRHSIHNRARSHDQGHYSDTESITKRPAPGPVYTAPQSLGYSETPGTGGGYYKPIQPSRPINLHSSPPESLSRHRNSEQLPNRQHQQQMANGARRVLQRHKSWAAKDWRPVQAPQIRNQHHGYPERGGDRLMYTGSQEILHKQSGGNSSSKQNNNHSGFTSNYSNLEGAHFAKNIHRTFSDESLQLQSPSRRIASPPQNLGYTGNQRKGSHDVALVRPTTRGHINSHPSDRENVGDDDEDLDWNRLVSTASKAIESDAPNTTRSQDSSTDKENSSLLSGHSTPTQERSKDIELKCSRLEHDLHMEKRRSRDLERRLQLEKNKNDDLVKELEQLRKENHGLRKDLVLTKDTLTSFTESFLFAYDGPESAM